MKLSKYMLRRNFLVDQIYRGLDPFDSFPAGLYAKDAQGWSSSVHHFLTDAIEEIRPSTIVEIGVWKGRSVIHMSKKAKSMKLDCAVIAVDTWLGSAEHWVNSKYPGDLKASFGQPNIYKTFLQNIVSEGLTDIVLPIPLDSTNAANVLRAKKIQIDLLHIDAGHDFRSVTNDLTSWWPLLRPGGILVGDDYSDKWPEVVEAFDSFFGERGFKVETGENKCLVRKTP